MNPVIAIDQAVDVVVSFTKTSQLNRVMPLKMRWQGQDVHFTKLGMRHPARRGQKLIYLFDVSDGLNDYCLELDTATLRWQLLTIINGSDL